MPQSSACWAVNGSASRISSDALAVPTARVSVADSAESKLSPMPVNAVVNLADSEQMRRSQARASGHPRTGARSVDGRDHGLGRLVQRGETIGP